MDSADASSAAAAAAADNFPADPIPPPSWNVEAAEVSEQETELNVEDYLDPHMVPMPDAALIVEEAAPVGEEAIPVVAQPFTPEPPTMVQPIAALPVTAVAPAPEGDKSSRGPPAPESLRGRKPLTASEITRFSKLSYEYDAVKRTISRIKHDIDSEDMIPTEDEVRLLPHPTLLKGWKVEHRRRTLNGHEDKYYTHPLCSGGKLKSLKIVDSYIKMVNNIDASFQVLDAGSKKRPRARPEEEPGTLTKRPLTQEDMKEYVESFLEEAWQNLMNRDSVKPKSPLAEDVEAGDGDGGDGGDDSRPPGYYGLERRFPPF